MPARQSAMRTKSVSSGQKEDGGPSTIGAPTAADTNPSSQPQPQPPQAQSHIRSPSPTSKPARARLSDAQKKHNHIESEQKRRSAIRIEFDTLAEIVPGMAGQGRSEATLMHASVGHIRKLLHDRFELVKMAREKGMDVSEWDFEGLNELAAKANTPLHAVLQEQADERLVKRRKVESNRSQRMRAISMVGPEEAKTVVGEDQRIGPNIAADGE